MPNQTHNHNIVDADPHFSINVESRVITTTAKKVSIMQYDHKSERFSFDIPATIEGHDMLSCDRIEVHYCNTGTDRSTHFGVYTVDDVAVVTEDMPHCYDPEVEKIHFSWLIDQDCTQKAGTLTFAILFACTGEVENPETGETETGDVYIWATDIYNSIAIKQSMKNRDVVYETYSDILLKWKDDIDKQLAEQDEEIDSNYDVFKDEMEEYVYSTVNNAIIEPTQFATTEEVTAIFS